MLRFVIGDNLFFRTLRYFLHKHEFQVVDTHDFITAIKEVTGQNLEWFFDLYIFKPGHPVFDVSYNWDEGGNKLKLKVVQTQDTSRGIPIYTMPVIIGITTPGKKVSKKVWIKKKEEVFEFSVKEKPLMVRFDKGNYLLKEWKFDKSLDELLYQLKNDDVIGRMWAALELEEFKDSPSTVKGLIDSTQNDKFWAVRRNALNILGKIKRKEDVELFKEKCKDENSKVRTTALRVLSGYKDIKLSSFFRERFEKDDSYLAQSEALSALGMCGDSSQIPFLEEAAKMSSPRDMIKRAAEQAIELIKLREEGLKD
jgi:aminopeptidase N